MMKHKIGREEVLQAQQTLNRYRQGKANLEERIVQNEQWYRLRHWECMRGKRNEVEPVSGWLFNAIANKHADAMDNIPAASILPREEGDRAEAEMLSCIIPAVLESCEFEEVYARVWDHKLKSGTGVYGVFWDKDRSGGLGDIAIKRVDVLNLFWESGVTDIQDSANVFHVQLLSDELLLEQYPALEGKLGGISADVKSYLYDDTVDTTGKTAVVDWYYKKGGKLHFCKFCADQVLFATENEEAYRHRGWYDHGLYPFVFDPLFRTEGTPCGFGYIDVGKSAQEYIDRGNQAIMQNLLANTRPRHFIRADGSVNEQEYADLTQDFVHVDGALGAGSIQPIEGKHLSSIYVEVLNGKIDELKEVTGNRDISTGGTASGVTAASAIAAMQEAGSKLSRDHNKASYRAFRKVVSMVIELMRQFYELPRVFRITGAGGAEQFVRFSNQRLRPALQGTELGVELGWRAPVFDVIVTAERKSPYSRMSQNEMALQFYGAGFFEPSRAQQTLSCLQMMDFDGRDILMGRIAAAGEEFERMQRLLAAGAVGGGGNPSVSFADSSLYTRGPAGAADGKTAAKKKDGLKGESYVTKRARQRVAESTAPT